MKRTHKLLAVLLAVALIVLPACSKSDSGTDGNTGSDNTSKTNEGGESSANTGGNGEEPVKDPMARYAETVTFSTGIAVKQDPKLPEGATYENNALTKYIEDKLNVKRSIAWQVSADTPNAFRDKVSIAIASNDIPDVLVLDNQEQLRKLVENDMIEDLTSVYNDYASEEIKGYYEQAARNPLDAVTFDGKIMAIPDVQNQSDGMQLVWIRQDWLDKLKLPGPQTFDDLVAINKAFVEQDPDGNGKKDTFGIQLGQDPRNDALFNAQNAYTKIWVKGEDGSVTFGGIQPEAKAALARFAELYKAGLLDKEFAVKDFGKVTENVANGKQGIFDFPWWAPWWPLQDTLKNNSAAEWKPYALKDKNGVFVGTAGAVSTHFVVVKKGYAHPEAVMKILNLTNDYQHYRNKELLDLRSKPAAEGGYKEADPFAWPVFIYQGYTDPMPRFYVNINKVLTGEAGVETLNAEEKGDYDLEMKFQAEGKKDLAAWATHVSKLEACKLLATEKQNQVYSEFTGTTDTMAKKWSTLEDMQKQAYLKIIMGQEPVDYFDIFVKDWKAQGGEQIIKEINEQLNS